jgi:DNA-binding NtrC family response regulator
MANILVVDDERDVLDALARAIRLAGHNVTKAKTAESAIALTADHAFDLVVLDYIMPSMTGIALLNKIRSIQPTVRSVIVSGKIDSKVSDEAILAELRDSIEADAYLHKPLENAKLLQTIDHLVGETRDHDWKEIAHRNLKAKKRVVDVQNAEKRLNQHKHKNTTRK